MHLEALRIGTNVVLDFGCWSRDERSAIRWLAESVGTSCRLVYVPVNLETQRARIARRQSITPDQTFPMGEADLLRWRTLFEEPDTAELDGHEIGSPPHAWPGWPEWATDRWPSFSACPWRSGLGARRQRREKHCALRPPASGPTQRSPPRLSISAGQRHSHFHIPKIALGPVVKSPGRARSGVHRWRRCQWCRA